MPVAPKPTYKLPDFDKKPSNSGSMEYLNKSFGTGSFKKLGGRSTDRKASSED
jgi:hypothetical protein